ncbi:DUF2268 domain-containing putative Zn-dependent protease [Dyella telluris]|uniref:Lytic murein transglycosylase n=1 Tax=Dyella telluris TaxID=2763498 RepID=A0A7G8Q3U3_9GAMM|nr:DUF2268 domain-containing putative Zn-dependent protease [Dyella telluris]QNK01451.1 lytic murein transglycosylase [Dyella telluris]
MKKTMRQVGAILFAMAWTQVAPAAPVEASSTPAIHIDDVYLFYKVYDAAGGHPTVDPIQRDYVDHGSDGLHRFFEQRHTTSKAIADAIAAHPAMYADAKRCMAVLPQARKRLDVALDKLMQLDPSARSAPLTIAVGRGKPVAIADASGVMVGLEALCAISYLDANLEDRFVYVLAHEYAHVQQAQLAPGVFDDAKPTVLEASLIEGSAEFVGEQIAGRVSYAHLAAMARGHEKEIETRFAADEDNTDLSAWLYNGTLTKPGDMGYWVGYRIAKAYYQHAADKRQALREILGMSDPKAFLAKSGWYPGIPLP